MGAWYCSREQLKAALDFVETARNNAQVDRAIEAASRQVDRLCNRHRGGFWPELRTRSFDWPSLAAPTPGRIWLDEPGLITLTAVTSGGKTIPTSAVELYPDAGPPYTRIEIDRTTSYEFGLGSTPQKDVQITGLWGFDLNTAPAGTLAASVSSTTATVLDVSDSSQVGVGDLDERALVEGLGGEGEDLAVDQSHGTVHLARSGRRVERCLDVTIFGAERPFRAGCPVVGNEPDLAAGEPVGYPRASPSRDGRP